LYSDDSLGYEYPFALRIVARNIETICGRCEWYKFCRGCTIACLENEKLEKLNPQKVCLVIDWDPTALHLRYQMTQEFEHVEHWSLPDTVKKLSESVALYSCLESYTKEEELSEEEKYLCAKCNALQLATKKLQIWRLPPILVIANL
jgi:ubiquitin carboxyl-terminal hydrolase 6/32